MPTFKDLTGLRFGRLKVIQRVSPTPSGRTRWLCQCDCGHIITTNGVHLVSGRSKSCSCLRVEGLRRRFTTHGRTHSMEYSIWCGMKARCANPQSPEFKNYGGRGINVCADWLNSFERFYSDMGPIPSPRHSIERIDNNQGYFATNCHWATDVEQSRNKRLSPRNRFGIPGIRPNGNRYEVYIGLNGHKHYLGSAKTIEEARMLRQKGELQYWKRTGATILESMPKGE